MVTTRDGKLVIKTDDGDTKWRDYNPYKSGYETMKRHFRSGMLQGWNKFCYTGGILEIKLKLPGKPTVGGLWPAAWLLGNLGRATYESSTNKMWPWSFDKCDRKQQKAQEISACGITDHYDFNPGQGRGATEIDLLEVMPGMPDKLPVVEHNVHRPYNSMTLQIAPGIPANKKRPPPGTLPKWGFHWYENITFGENVSINPFFYGTYLGPTRKEEPAYRSPEEAYQADAIGSFMQLNESNWNEFAVFRLEWEPGPHGYVRWYVDDEFKFGIAGEGLNAASGAQIPEEPSYVILNTAISTSWGFPDTVPWGCTEYDCKTKEGKCGFHDGFCESLPAEFQIEYVRVYQDKNNSRHTLGCNPKKFPTAKYIKAHTFKYLTPLQYQTEALLPVKKGGGLCNANDPLSCGGPDMGSCNFFSRCTCTEDWTGPNCKQPTYCNDFPDWESGEWISILTLPRPSIFLMVCLAMLGVMLVVVVTQVKFDRDQRATAAGNSAPATSAWGKFFGSIVARSGGYEPVAFTEGAARVGDGQRGGQTNGKGAGISWL